jgi:hypothetical protein
MSYASLALRTWWLAIAWVLAAGACGGEDENHPGPSGSGGNADASAGSGGDGSGSGGVVGGSAGVSVAGAAGADVDSAAGGVAGGWVDGGSDSADDGPDGIAGSGGSDASVDGASGSSGTGGNAGAASADAAPDAGTSCIPKYAIDILPFSVPDDLGVRGINEVGQIVGSTLTHPYRYTPGQPLETSFGNGNAVGVATDIDDNGAIVGAYEVNGLETPFRWDPPGSTPVGGWSTGLHILGAGGGTPPAMSTNGLVLAPTQVWPGPVPIVSPVSCSGNAAPFDINANGMVVGLCAVVSSPSVPIRYAHGGYTAQILPLPPGIQYGAALRANDQDEIVGFTLFAGNLATVWRPNGTITQLTSIDPVNPNSQGMDINNAGVVVGWSGASSATSPAAGQYAVVWSANGQIADLNTLACTRLFGDALSVDPMLTSITGACSSAWSTFQLVKATAVNESGQIAGFAWNCVTKLLQPFILTPIP